MAPSRAPSDLKHSIQVKKDLKTLTQTLATESQYPNFFSVDEILTAGISEKYAKPWLPIRFSNILQTANIPKSLEHAKSVAILKPDKPAHLLQNCRLISLLSATYKLLESLI